MEKIVNTYKRFFLKKKQRLFYKEFSERIKNFFLIPDKNNSDIFLIVNKISEIKGVVIDENVSVFNIPEYNVPLFFIDFNKKRFEEDIERIKICLQA